MARKKKYPEGQPMLGVGALNDINPQNRNFVNDLKKFVKQEPAILTSHSLVQLLNVALFKANEGEAVKSVAQELDHKLAAYVAQNPLQAPSGLQKLRQTLQTYYAK